MDTIQDIVKQYSKLLDEKKLQTTYKIKYVAEYVRNWLKVWVNYKKTTTINFVDCMCNAGVYQDGDIGTAVKVIKLFKIEAYQHQNIQFKVWLNYYNTTRIEIIKKVVDIEVKVLLKNLKIEYDNQDVNDYLDKGDRFNRYFEATTNFAAVLLLQIRMILEQLNCQHLRIF